jgi:hypothetical protein
MAKAKGASVRINIYVHDPAIRRQIKTIAAQRDLSVSDYCLKAIAGQLAKEQESAGEGGVEPLKEAVEKARKFHTKHFGEKVFSLNSAALIRESRKERGAS